ncbi:methanobactin export MATE transporter MbnM [Comamonas sp. JC664]|uniref:methanobactin export MATE transporter MbnM n=1 Tax=Comamonas sp. JC664 TaxID=2801917 RepID=UPI001749E5AE|nr:methanobactin export MATE transporter MbnM [Comamonas sp. JC664]MBL0697337.1 di-heme enzyme [Comamonas sp. JC664]GHG67133.1 di-heme enzyme [Comamonas sp. KCTC 72670]
MSRRASGFTKLLAVVWLAGGCGGASAGSGPEPYDWRLPAGFPTPRVPADNPMTEAKVALGRRLFYDVRLSQNGTQSCGSCHEQARAFTDGLVAPVGSTGQQHRRNSQGLANVVYATSFTWANPTLTSLESQALVPLFGKEPVELGFGDRQDELLERLRSDPELVAAFAKAFPEAPEPVSVATLARALASFQRSLISGNAPFDRYVYGNDASALSREARRGMELFFSERLECDHCHSGFNFQDATVHEATSEPILPFHNTGLYNEDGQGTYPAEDPGLIELTGRAEDMGRFRAPSLRNVAVTGPYMHDGSLETLSDVLDHYAAGGHARLVRGGEASPLQSGFVRGFTLTAQEKEDVLAFLESLTDTAFLTDPRFSDPFATP